jgi:hypothetical protein
MLAEDDVKGDRPGFTDPADTLARGVAQFESGVSLQHQKNGPRLLTLPTPLLRVGVSDRVEVRLGGDGYLRQTDGRMRETTSGRSDMYASVKVRLCEESGRLPAVTLLPGVSLPSGDPSFSSAGFDPAVKLALGKQIAWGVGLGGNVGVASLSAAGSRHRETISSVTASRALGRRVSCFGELYASAASGSEEDGASRIVDGGLTFAVGHNAQADLSIGRGLTAGGPAWFVAGGLVLRHPRSWFPKLHR